MTTNNTRIQMKYTTTPSTRQTRKRTLRHPSLVMASAFALSVSCASCFQSIILPTPVQRTIAANSKLSVVTDPRRFVIQSANDDNDDNESGRQLQRSALEDIYLLSTDTDGLSGTMIEKPVRSTKVKSREKVKLKGVRKEKVLKGSVTTKNRIQFNGLSTTNGRKKRKMNRKIPTIDSEQAMAEQKAQSMSKSSTMPGFMQRAESDRMIAYRKGIKLAEKRSGKKFTETAEENLKRRKANGNNMYKSSDSVPDSLVQFANEIHSVSRITPKEEILLGEKTQEAIRLQSIYNNLAEKLDREPTDDEWCASAGKINMEAITQAIEEGLEAKNRLVESNLRMVQGVVNVYIRNGLRGQYNAGDLMQEGIMALIRAAEKFDPSRGFRFSTYAMYWIRAAVKRSQIYQSRVVTVPQRLYENHKRILRVQKELTLSLGRPPTKAEIGDVVGMSEVQIERCLKAMAQRCFSLDQEISNPSKPMSASSNHDTMYEVIENKAGDSDDFAQKQIFLREDLIETLRRNLTDEETTLLLLRYGLSDSDSVPKGSKTGSLTIAEVSRMVGMKPDKVRRMINKSLKQLKATIGDEWRDFDREFQP